jgi:hypothetical protein
VVGPPLHQYDRHHRKTANEERDPTEYFREGGVARFPCLRHGACVGGGDRRQRAGDGSGQASQSQGDQRNSLHYTSRSARSSAHSLMLRPRCRDVAEPQDRRSHVDASRQRFGERAGRPRAASRHLFRSVPTVSGSSFQPHVEQRPQPLLASDAMARGVALGRPQAVVASVSSTRTARIAVIGPQTLVFGPSMKAKPVDESGSEMTSTGSPL